MFALGRTLNLLTLVLISAGPLPLWLHHALEHHHACGPCPATHAEHHHEHATGSHESSSESWSSDPEHCAACFQLSQATLKTGLTTTEHRPYKQPELRTEKRFLYLANELGAHLARGPPSA